VVFLEVVPGEVYRSAQPSPATLKRWVRQYGLKTVVNLRGPSDLPFHAQEREAARAAGVNMIDIRFTASRQPTAPWLRRFIETLESAPRPILLHCRDGIDRAGIASVMAAMAIGGKDYASAEKQMFPRFGRSGRGQRHIIDLLDDYEEYCRRGGVPTGRWRRFRRWAMEKYYPYYYRIELEAPHRVSVEPGRQVEVSVRIINRSRRVIPAGGKGRQFMLGAFWGVRRTDWPAAARQIGPQFRLPKRNLEPGAGTVVTHRFAAPAEPGVYPLHFDVAETHVTWFAREGSAVTDCRLIVRPATNLATIAGESSVDRGAAGRRTRSRAGL